MHVRVSVLLPPIQNPDPIGTNLLLNPHHHCRRRRRHRRDHHHHRQHF